MDTFCIRYGSNVNRAMATLTIKNLPDRLYQRLKETARRHRRSINSEAIVRLEQALQHVEPNEEELIRRIRALRAEFPVHMSEAERHAAIEEGRA